MVLGRLSSDAMRLWFAVGGLLCVLGCAGPRSTGALWSQQNQALEAAGFRLSEAQRVELMQTFERSLADEALAAERTRLTGELETCPGPSEPLSVSKGDRVRDAIRLRAAGDASRLNEVAQLALADWRLRRAAATGNAAFCADAQAALTGTASPVSSSDLLTDAPAATVTRDPRYTTAPLSTDPPSEILSAYALGYVDTVQASAPLPQYLALVYGGSVVSADAGNVVDQETAARLVDRDAAAYPDWEPDALYAALRGGQA
jgi:hypothetical protein